MLCTLKPLSVCVGAVLVKTSTVLRLYIWTTMYQTTLCRYPQQQLTYARVRVDLQRDSGHNILHTRGAVFLSIFMVNGAMQRTVGLHAPARVGCL